jgi:hypothetical protein
MLSPDDPDARHIIAGIVRTIAAGTGFTTLMRIGDSPLGPFAITDSYVHQPDLDYAALLHAAAVVERARPLGVPIDACALVLPDRDIAYIKHGTASMTTLTVGRNPVDEPDTHQGVHAGLDVLMQAISDTQPTSRPHGRAFPPPTAPAPTPDASPGHGHASGWPPPPPSAERRGPHR